LASTKEAEVICSSDVLFYYGLHSAISQKMANIYRGEKAEKYLGKHLIFGNVEAFTAVIMKNAVFWDIKPQFVPHRRHITSPLQIPAS
jgi:hypothetical protein